MWMANGIKIYDDYQYIVRACCGRCFCSAFDDDRFSFSIVSVCFILHLFIHEFWLCALDNPQRDELPSLSPLSLSCSLLRFKAQCVFVLLVIHIDDV
jgi:hypothetical protein